MVARDDVTLRTLPRPPPHIHTHTHTHTLGTPGEVVKVYAISSDDKVVVKEVTIPASGTALYSLH